MNGDDPAKTSEVLADVAELQAVIEHSIYSDADKALMLAILRKHEATGSGGLFFLQEPGRRLYSGGRSWPMGAGIGSDPGASDRKHRANHQRTEG